MDKKYSIHIGNVSYNLDTRNYFRNLTEQQQLGRQLQIVRIQDKDGQELTNARIWGTWEEVEKEAQEWLTAILVANPTNFLRYTIEAVRA